MLESKLQEVALGILGDKIADEEEKKKVEDELHMHERELNDHIAQILRELRRDLDSGDLRNRFTSDERDNIVKKVGENIKRSEYTGL